ncbi:MAG: L,D-transpeptidase family protein [Novosphingobium sp.]|nr:L,D-transpeptidase family protein [Novosphingobium sp.]
MLAMALLGLAALAGGSMMLEQTPVAREAAPSVAAAQTGTTKAANPESPVSTRPAVDERFIIKRILPISGPIRYGEWFWDDAGVPDGPIVIPVDLEARVLSIFRGGYEIGAAAVLLGTEEKPTPIGVFPITEKKRHHVSNLYAAPMPYMQRLTDDGISLHASQVEWGYASHGCIGMPEEFARRVFEQTRLGDRVFITRGKRIGLGDSLIGS